MAKGGGNISVGFQIVDVGNGMQKLNIDAKDLQKTLQNLGVTSEKVTSEWFKLGALSTSFANLRKALGDLHGALNNLTAEAGDFGGAMRKANTMAGASGKDFDALKDSITDLAKEIPKTRAELADGLYAVVSNGVPKDNWIDYLKASARSSVGGIADLGQTITVTSTLIKNYGLEWDKARDLQDKMQLTAKNGVTTFEQLSQALPRVAGNAATLGVSVDELMATFATLTGVSGNTAEVSTQLAAVFTSLIKPTSEAGKMAEAMGIQFNAASIKAAGGLAPFLQLLDTAVKQYAASSGVLEQEVYGKLFGSAESLRALGPLTGQLAKKFEENVAAMRNSAGTMDAAYDQIASGAAQKTQMIQNKFAELGDYISKVYAPIKPFTGIISGALQTVASLSIVITSFGTLTRVTGLATLASKAWTAACSVGRAIAAAWTQTVTYCAGATSTYAVSATGAAGATRLLRSSIQSLLIVTGVGIAIVALTEALTYLYNVLTDTTDEAEQASAALDSFKQAQEASNATVKQSIAQYNTHLAQLKNFKGDKAAEKTLVEELNNTYGKVMGRFKTVAEWYNALTRNSKTYCAQLRIEAGMRLWADRIAQLEAANYNITHTETGKTKVYSTERKQVKDFNQRVLTGYDNDNNPVYDYGLKTLPSDLDKANAQLAANNKKIAAYTAQLNTLGKQQAALSMPVMGDMSTPTYTAPSTSGTGKPGSTSAGKTAKEEVPVLKEWATTLKDIQANVAYYNNALQSATAQTAPALLAQRDHWQTMADAILGANKATKEMGTAVTDTEAKFNPLAATLEEINENLRYYDQLLLKASNPQEYANILRRRERDVKHRNYITGEGKDTAPATGMPEASTMDKIQGGWSGIKGIVGGVQSMTAALKEHKSAWETVVAVIDGALGIYNSITTALQIFGMIKQATSPAVVAANNAEAESSLVAAGASMTKAQTDAMASNAGIPVVGVAMGIAAAAAITAAILSMTSKPKPFAAGGIVSGPTLALVGEYGGARNNPEVIAPLNKLREYMPNAGGGAVVSGELRAHGRDLVAVLANETRTGARAGRQTNIKI